MTDINEINQALIELADEISDEEIDKIVVFAKQHNLSFIDAFAEILSIGAEETYNNQD